MEPEPDDLSEQQILAGLSGDEVAQLSSLRAAMESYTYRLAGLAKQYVGSADPHDIVDVVDRTFQALWERHQDIRGSLWSWLAGVTVKQAISLTRKKARRSTLEPISLQAVSPDSGLSLEENGELMLIAEGIENPWSGLVLEEYMSQFAECVQDLPPAQKLVGRVMLQAAKNTGEIPDNDHILSEVRRLSGNQSISLEAVKSAKKQVLAKLRPRIAPS